jgi:hypothetical protein
MHKKSRRGNDAGVFYAIVFMYLQLIPSWPPFLVACAPRGPLTYTADHEPPNFDFLFTRYTPANIIIRQPISKVVIVSPKSNPHKTAIKGIP